MTTRTLAPVLPIEVRRQLWDRLWRDVLLRPRPRPQPPASLRDDDDQPDEVA